MYLSDGARRARRVAWLAAAVVWAGLLLLPWWPMDFGDPYFMQYRLDAIERYREYGDDWWDVVPYGYYQAGYLLHMAAVVAMPLLVARRGWHWPAGIVVLLASVWEFIAVVPYSLINTTVVPYLPMVAGAALMASWLIVRNGVEDSVMAPARG
ncbi:hypothetical protein Acsp01_81940 [Actinoplanes sp. NBRC 101535]|nr:hypothetical protein Acsp01_81940 [Actinoplanes sp. NBRC 101535]